MHVARGVALTLVSTLALCVACREVTVAPSPPGVFFHFSTDRAAYAAADTVRITLTNDGTSPIEGSFCPAWLDHWTGATGWTQVTSTAGMVCDASLIGLQSGDSRSTWFVLPTPFAPGEYRVSYQGGSLTHPWNTPPFTVTGLPANQLDLPDSTSLRYWSDATALAIRELQRGTPVDAQSIEVPDTLIADLYGALAALYHSSLAARDSVVQLFKLHAVPATGAMTVGVMSAAPWIDWWKRGSTVTYTLAIDTLMAKYGLRVQRFWTWPDGQSVTLLATRPMNMPALAPLFARVSGVRYAEAFPTGGDPGDASDIAALPMNGGWQLEFKMGWGDCPAGCISRHYWTFSVDASRTVRFEGSRGPAVGTGIP
jgi:hypothetical protein